MAEFRSFVFIVPLVAALACSEQSGETVAARTDALDFDTGDIVGEATWYGVPVADLAGPRNLAADRLTVTATDAEGDFAGATPFLLGAYALQNIGAGSVDLALDSFGCNTADIAQNVEVIAGNVTTADFDLETGGGIVEGAILVNGAPLPNPNVQVDGACTFSGCAGHCPGGNAAGGFSKFLPPGDYTASVTAQRSVVGTFDFSIALGAVTDVGTLEFSTGDIAGALLWNGVPLGALDAPANLAVEQNIEVIASAPEISRVSYGWLDGEGAYALSNVQAGPVDLGYHTLGCSTPDQTIDVEVLPEQETTADFELAQADGLVIGNVTVNGAPLSHPNLRIEGQCSWFSCAPGDCPASDAGGAFARVLSPGNYTIDFGSGFVFFGSAAVSVGLGAVTDLGALDFGAGDVSGAATWNGVPLADLDPPANLAAEQLMWVVATTATTEEAGFADFDSTGHYALPTTPTGDVDLAFYTLDCNDPDQVVGVSVGAGSAISADVDFAQSNGQLVGSISVNGAPLPYPNIVIDGACMTNGCGAGSPCPTSDETGAFARIVPPGDHSADILSGSAVVGSFSFSIRQGEVTDVDVGGTPAGFDVFVGLSGGTGSPGGITLVFSEVTAAGQTTVVESGAGPPPDTGFRIVGLNGQPRYWDIDTTAEYVPPIEVCISYDESEVGGNEENLQLRHDDGSGWEDITTSIDTDANVICGEAASLSPFAVFEPIDADGDDDGVSDALDECPGTRAGAVVGADGCALAQLCPCRKAWRNHGAYVACQRRAIREFVEERLISRRAAARLLGKAERSSCGKLHKPRHHRARRH